MAAERHRPGRRFCRRPGAGRLGRGAAVRLRVLPRRLRARGDAGSQAGLAGPERETLKAFRSVPLVCFPFVYMTLYFWESRRPPHRQHPKQQGLA